jgi:hypothetical protein
MSLITVDQPLKPKVLSELVFPNFTSSVGFPAEGGGVGDGGGVVEEVTVTVVDWLAEPPVPVQVRVNVVFAVMFSVLCEPEIGFVPDHPPEAVHVLALVEFHTRTEEVPAVMEVGLADKVTVGVGDEGALLESECLYK